MKRRAIAFLIASLAACPAAAQLAPEISDAPIDVTGERLEVEDDVATWFGDVRAVQGGAILTADKLIATLDENGGFKKLRAVGNVRYSNGEEAIAGEVGVYDAAKRTITITKDVVVTQGEQVMTGGELVYWVDSKRLRFTAPEGRRIRGVFYPEKPGVQS